MEITDVRTMATLGHAYAFDLRSENSNGDRLIVDIIARKEITVKETLLDFMARHGISSEVFPNVHKIMDLGMVEEPNKVEDLSAPQTQSFEEIRSQLESLTTMFKALKSVIGTEKLEAMYKEQYGLEAQDLVFQPGTVLTPSEQGNSTTYTRTSDEGVWLESSSGSLYTIPDEVFAIGLAQNIVAKSN